MDLNREAKVPTSFNLFEVTGDNAPGRVPKEDVASEIRAINDSRKQRARQVYGKVEALHHPLPDTLSTRRALDLIESYFHIGRGVLWRFNLEALAHTKQHETRDSARWLAASYVFRQMTPENRDYVRRSVSDVQLALNWEKLRVAYSVDPGLHRALLDTDPGGTPIPPQVLRQLPHADPVFLLPQGVPVTLADGAAGVMRAFFLRGLVRGQHAASTSDEEASHYQICALSSVGGAGEAPTDWDLSGVSVPLDHPFTMESASQTSAGEWDDMRMEAIDRVQVQAWTLSILRICLPVVLYCCSVNADAQAAAAPAKTRPRGKRRAEKAAPVARTYNLGYRVGPALTRTAVRRTVSAQTDETGVVSARRRRTHIRRAHWHTYWYGPRDGERTPRLKWVAMRVINENVSDPVTTVILVK